MKYILTLKDLDGEDADFEICAIFSSKTAATKAMLRYATKTEYLYDYDILSDGEIIQTPRMYGRPRRILFIKKVPASKLEYRLLHNQNGDIVKRRFTTRQNAVNWVVKFFDNIDCNVEESESVVGNWSYQDYHISVRFVLIVGEMLGSNASREEYAKILGVDATASEDEVRSAYRKKSKQNHPDMGGDEKEFIKIQEAYENFFQTKSSRATFSPIGFSVDPAFFDESEGNEAAHFQQKSHNGDRPIYSQPRSQTAKVSTGEDVRNGSRDFLVGIIVFMVAALISYGSYQSAKPGEKYTVFTGFMIYGGYLTLRGIFRIIRNK